ncbi:hypothetical protein ACLOJK_028499 [Asimina triloba]
MVNPTFTPGGGFALGDYKSFDPAVLHQFIRVPASMAQRTYIYAATIAAVSSTLWPSRKAATIVTATSVSRPTHKATTPTPQSAHKTASATFTASSASGRIKRRSRKAGPASRRTTRLNRQDVHLYRPVLVTAPLTLKADARGDLHPGWCYPPRQHNTYPRLVADYWVQVKNPNKFRPLIKLSKAQAWDLKDRGTFSSILRPTEFPRHPHPRKERCRQRSQMVTASNNVVTTRLVAEEMPIPPSSCSLSHPYGHRQPAFSDSPTAASCMVGEEEPEQLSPQAAHQKILKLEVELRRMRDVMNSFEATGITPPQGVRKSLHSIREHAAN